MKLDSIKDSLKTKFRSGAMKTLSANVINKAVQMLSTMIITRILTKGEYGIWSYALNIFSYLGLVNGLGLISGCLQFGTENKGKDKAYDFYKYCLKVGLVIDIVIVVVALVIVSVWKLPIAGSKVYVIAVIPGLLIDYYNSTLLSMLRSQNRISEYAKATNVNTISMAIGTCVGAFFGIIGVVCGRYIGRMISVSIVSYYVRFDVNCIKHGNRLVKKDVYALWHYSLFTGASSAMNCLVYYIDVSLIAALIKNAEDISIYKVGTLIPNALQFIPQSIIIAILPTIVYNRNKKEWLKDYLKKIYLLIFACNAVIAIGVIIFSPLIITIFSGQKYMDSVPVMRVLILGYFFSGTFRGLSINTLAAFRRVKYGLFISVTSCITDVLFNYLLINRFGMIGAAYATLLVDIVTATLSFGYVLVLLKRGTINAIDEKTT